MIYKIVTGGQTGVDRAALDVALESDVACGGWCPKGRTAEDGPIDAKYPLVETPTSSLSQRTEWNVRDSDATLVLTWGPVMGGTLKTVAIAARLKKNCLVLDMKEQPKGKVVEDWIEKINAHVLNIAGPRASEVPEAYAEAKAFLLPLFMSEDDEEEIDLTVDPALPRSD